MNNCSSIAHLFVVLLLSLVRSSINSTTDQLKVFGPGWDTPQLIFPSRYFFVCNTQFDTVEINSLTDERCPVWTQVFKETNFDGCNNFTVVRYKLLNSVCRGIQIKLLDDVGSVIASKSVKEDVWAEECHCPQSDWHLAMKCDQMANQFDQIERDLKQFHLIDFDNVLEEMKSRFAPHTRSFAFCHYQIVENQIYKRCFGEYVGFSQFLDDILSSLLRKTSVPDVEFVANLGDWPLSDRRGNQIPLPIFSWCGSDDTDDIVMPTYELTESTLHMQSRVSIDVLSVFGKQPVKFQDKSPLAFWRGRDSNQIRLKLVKLSKDYPDLINASLTNFFFFRDKIDEFGPSSPHVSMFDFFQHKYQLSVDGTVAAYRLPYLLAGTSVILKQESKFYEYFYSQLKRNHHFILVDAQLDNLIEILQNLTVLPEKEQLQIITNARQFVLDNVLPQHVYCYYFNLLTRFVSLLKNSVKLKDTELIESNFKCSCKNDKKKDEL